MIGESESRPWGSWTVLDEDEKFKVKRIEVKPHARLYRSWPAPSDCEQRG